MKNFQAFVSAVLAGILVALGSVASIFLGVDSPIASAVFFSAGLMAVAIFELHLFTDNLGSLFKKNLASKQAAKTFSIWLGNIVGALLVGVLMLPKINELAKDVVRPKLNISFLSLCIGSILCGMLIYVAIHGYRKASSGFLGCAVIFSAGSLISICDFEYALTNALYIGAAFDTPKYYIQKIGEVCMLILFVAVGNIIGALFFSALNNLKDDDLKIKKRHRHGRKHHSHEHHSHEHHSHEHHSHEHHSHEHSENN